MNVNTRESAKKAAAFHAINFVEDGMLIGLGTGSTSAYFIEALGKRVSEGLKILCVATSLSSEIKAMQQNIPLVDINTLDQLDLCFDGADEIDLNKQMIKGGGGALLREKIVAHMALEMIVLVDESKVVDHLGKFLLPVEITPFAYQVTMRELKKLGYLVILRMVDKETPFITDNDNYIVDLQLKFPILDPEKENLKIKAIPGVLETGFFISEAGRVVIGYDDGQTEVK